MSDPRRDSIPHRSRSELIERIEELRTTVQRLGERVEDLDTKRTRLQEENQALRQKLTHARLIDGILASLGEGTHAPESVPEPSPTLVSLHRALPASFSFPTFFQVAEDEGVDAADARRYLRRFLNRGYLARNGAQLRKQDPVPEEG